MPDVAAVIVNTSPLFYLHQAGFLDILHTLYGSIVIPAAVQRELETGRREGYDVPDVTSPGWIHVRSANLTEPVPALSDLGLGESEVIALGIESPDSLLIIDDQLARRVADLHSLRYTGTLGVLIRAKREGHILSVGAAITRMKEIGMWLSDTIVDEALRLAGEKP